MAACLTPFRDFSYSPLLPFNGGKPAAAYSLPQGRDFSPAASRAALALSSTGLTPYPGSLAINGAFLPLHCLAFALINS
ncbi:hypothetical protein [Pelotomaculum sp. PtaB.Bin117]|uniref:hypothetical protein n=1 Tax=Pelotomaculum sp. PtaB.Bin117 TaxID=1811694 RepID=UPI00257A6D90|nr:hypothetical protein [Pelotomaculum sp. PtaB.Bin117]